MWCGTHLTDQQTSQLEMELIKAIAKCMYVAGLFTKLEKRGSGCWINGKYRGIWGHSDDNWSIAPSLTSLQDMIYTMEQYAASYNLQFSMDQNPEKCKTKCLAFLKEPRELVSMKLCGHPLPWVNTVNHLGITVKNTINVILTISQTLIYFTSKIKSEAFYKWILKNYGSLKSQFWDTWST